MKDFETTKKGVVQAFLLDCTSSGTSCNLIDSGSKTLDPWSGGSSTWVSRTINFGSVTYSVPSGRSLAVKVVVGDQSGDDMWFAYDTTSYPSSLTVELAAAPTITTTTSAPSTTTTTAPTTTTSAPSTTITTAATTTTTSPGATTTSTSGTSTTTSTIPSETTTSTTLGVSGSTTTLFGSAIPPGAATTTEPLISTAPPQEGQSGGQMSGGDDPALPPLLDPGQMGASVSFGLSGAFIDALELVIPPVVATALVSPLLILEALAAALFDTGQALLISGLLLLVGAAWVASGARLTGLLGYRRRRRQEEAEQ